MVSKICGVLKMSIGKDMDGNKDLYIEKEIGEK